MIINDPTRRAMISVAFGRFLKTLGFEGYSYHSLRATQATAMAAKGATIGEIAKALGQKGTSATQAYIRRQGSAKVASAGRA